MASLWLRMWWRDEGPVPIEIRVVLDNIVGSLLSRNPAETAGGDAADKNVGTDCVAGAPAARMCAWRVEGRAVTVCVCRSR